MNICYWLLFLVVVARETYCGVIAETQKDAEVETDKDSDDAQCGLEPEKGVEGEETGNSPLLYDTNIDHPSVDGTDSVKHKRCHHSVTRVGASLEPRAGIVGSRTPQAVERRDVPNKFYLKACNTCRERNICEGVADCPVCEKWCSKVSGPNDVDTVEVVGLPQEEQPPEGPVVSVRSNFDDDKRKNVYTITTLRTGAAKELIMKLMGVADTDDIDTVVIWVTTHSNHPPVIAAGFHRLDPGAEKMAERVKEELKKALQDKFREHGDKFVTEGGEELDKVIRGVLNKMHPPSLFPGLGGLDDSHVVGSKSGSESSMLPRYPIESETLVVPQSLNPDIIEGPPDFKTLNDDGEEGDQFHLGVKNEQDLVENEPSLEVGSESVPFDNRPRPFAANQEQETIVSRVGADENVDERNLGSPLELDIVEEPKVSEKSQPLKDPKTGRAEMAPGARLREFIDNVKANIANSKNALPIPKKLSDGNLQNLDGIETETLGRIHHNGGRGHIRKGHPHTLFTHRSSSQDDNIGSMGTEVEKPKNEEIKAINPAPGTPSQKIPLLGRMKSLNPSDMLERLRSKTQLSQGSQRLSEPEKTDVTGSDTAETHLGSKMEENSESINPEARAHLHLFDHEKRHFPGGGKGQHIGHDPGHHIEHDPGHHIMHDPGHHIGHGPGHHIGHGPGHHIEHGVGHGPGHHKWQGHHEHDKLHINGFHRSSELGSAAVNDSRERIEINPGFENEMLSESIAQLGGASGDSQNNPGEDTSSVVLPSESRAAKTVVPVKFNVGARANELIQKLKEKQEMRKASSPFGGSRSSMIGSDKPLEGTIESTVDSGRQMDSLTLGAQKIPGINNFETAEAALGKVSDLSKDLQEITDTDKPSRIQIKPEIVAPKPLTDNAEETVNVIRDEDKNPTVGSPVILGSQPLDSSIERIQPTMSLSGRPWRHQNSGSLFKEGKNEVVGSTNQESDLENQDQNKSTGVETVAGSNPGINTRGQFESEQNTFSNSMGVIVPAGNPVDFLQKPSDVYFLGNGIKLPLKMVKDNDGAMHLSVDLDKLCSCNNITCPKNHTVLEKAVETILENEAELKDQLEPIESEVIHTRNNEEENFGDMPLGMASPQEILEADPIPEFNPSNGIQSRMGAFADEDPLEDTGKQQLDLPHRNERDTVENSGFLNTKNKKVSHFESMELQSENAGILKRSPELKATHSSINSIPAATKFVASADALHKSGHLQRDKNLLSKSTPSNDKLRVSEPITDEDSKATTSTRSTPPTESTTKALPSTIKPASSETNYIQDFMNKRLDDIRSRLKLTNEEMKKELSFPQYFFKNLLTAAQAQAEKVIPKSNAGNLPSTLGSRLGSLFGKTTDTNNEIYDNIAPINRPYKFKALENQLKWNLEHIGDTVDNYTKQDDDILKKEVAALEKINENPVVKKEVGIASNILKFFKDLAADKNKK